MKERYEKLEAEIVEFETEDVIMESGIDGGEGGDEGWDD